jgi:2-hydroxychromene-2-carboxylate isomerase
VEFRPVNVLALMQRVGNTPTSLHCKAKGRYQWRDAQRWAQRYRVPIAKPEALGKLPLERLRRAAALVPAESAAQFVRECMGAIWTCHEPTSDWTERLEPLAHWFLEPNVDTPKGAARADAQLEANLAQAESDGVFGVPSLVVGDDLFFGNDRLHFAIEHLQSLQLSGGSTSS